MLSSNKQINFAYTVAVLISAALISLFMRFIIGFDGLYGQDSYEYLRYANAIKTYLTTGISPGDYFWPVWYPITGVLISFIVQDMALSLQLVSAISLALVVIYSSKIIGLLNPISNNRISNMYSMVFIGLAPFLFRLGFIVMSDMLTLALIVLGFYFLISATISLKFHHILSGLILASTACMTRYAAFLIIAPMCLYTCWIFIRKNKNWYYIFPAFILSLLPLIPHILIRTSRAADFLKHDLLMDWSIINFLKLRFVTMNGTSTYTLPNIINSLSGLFHPRYCLFAIFILVAGFRKIKWTQVTIVIAISILTYSFFIAGIPFQNNRFLALAQPLLMILLFSAAYHLIHPFKPTVKIAMITATIVIQIVLVPIGFYSVFVRNKFERDLYQYLQTIGSPTIYTMDVDIALKEREYPSNIYNIFTQTYLQPDTNAIIIYNEKSFNTQWKGMNPSINWNNFNKSYNLKEIKHYSNGYGVYKFH